MSEEQMLPTSKYIQCEVSALTSTVYQTNCHCERRAVKWIEYRENLQQISTKAIVSILSDKTPIKRTDKTDSTA